MDLLFASASPLARWRLGNVLPVCFPESNGTQSTNALWKTFSYGTGSQEIHAMTPANSSLAVHLTGNYEQNFGLILSLAKHGDPSKFIVHLDLNCLAVDSHGDLLHPALTTNATSQLLQDLSRPSLPYQVEYAKNYKFNPSHCGRFLNHRPCWFDVGTDNPFEPGMVLVSPEAIPRSECYDRDTNAVGPHDASRRRTKLLELTSRGNAWHPDEICPDYRLLCGSDSPPNLSPTIASCDHRGGKWLQMPISSCEEGDTGGDCEGQTGLKFGRLPPFEDPTMHWYNVAEDSEVCEASTMHEARRIIEQFKRDYPLCNNFYRWVAREARAKNWAEAAPNPRNPNVTRWDLFEDNYGTFQFVPRPVNSSRGRFRIQVVDPLSLDRVFTFDGLPVRQRLSVAAGAASGHWISQAALAAALAITRGVVN